MSVVVAHARVGLAELARMPTFAVPTLLFPLLTYLFVTRGAVTDVTPELAMAGVAGIAVLGVMFFQFGVGIALERTTPWERYVRTLPAGPPARIAARVLAAVPVAFAAAGLVVALAVAADGVTLPLGRWLLLGAALLAGGAPFALAGIALGYWLPPRSAVPLANLVFLAGAIAGGLWSGPAKLPDELVSSSAFVPTRRWGELLWASVEGQGWRLSDVAVLALYGILFALLALWGYRRDQGEQFA